MERHPNKNDVEFYDQDDDYLKLHFDLKSVYDLEEVKSPIYLLVYDDSANVFRYLVRSDKKVYYKHEYVNFPEKLSKFIHDKEGGILPLYMSDYGSWLSAVEPILDAQGRVIALVEVDENAESFFAEVQDSFQNQVLFTLLGIIVIALIMLPLVRKILNGRGQAIGRNNLSERYH